MQAKKILHAYCRLWMLSTCAYNCAVTRYHVFNKEVRLYTGVYTTPFCTCDAAKRNVGSDGKIISWILIQHLEKLTKEKKAAMLKESITVKELIKWKVWSSMLKVASKYEPNLFCAIPFY